MNNLPSAFITRIRQQFPGDAASFLQALQTSPPVSIRLNPDKLTIPETPFLCPLTEEQVPWCSQAWYLNQRPVFTLDPCFHSGAYYVQEASSMFPAFILRQIMPQRPLRVLDLCAAPGGKSTLLASLLPAGSLLVCNEVIRSRASILKENLIKWGCDHVVVTSNDPSAFKALKGAFDIILTDVPCSGEGMFRKDPKAVEEWSESNLRLCAERQRRILNDIWDSLKTDGWLIYSTCTYNPEENEKMLEWILQHYKARSIEIHHSFNGVCSSTEIPYCYHFYPHRISGEGFFTGVIQKQEAQEEIRIKKTNTPKDSLRLPPEIQSLLLRTEDIALYKHENILGLIPLAHQEFIRLLEKHLRIVYQGCELAELNNRKVKMQHALALSSRLDKSRCTVYEASPEEAIRYLKKEDITVNTPPGAWVLITHQGIALGWGKNLGNRLNNYYPKEWRIRMDIRK